MEMNDLIIASVDDHVIEPPTMWDQHLPAKYANIKPKLLRNEQGVDYWLVDGVIMEHSGLNAVVGRVREEYGAEPTSLDEMRPGVYDIKARIDDMNANGVLSSLNFPSMAGFDGSFFKLLPNQDNAMVLLRAYNDWHIDEWCGSYPGRNIPLAIVPFWNVPEAVAEVKRVAAKGCHAISLSDNPNLKGCPSIHEEVWEPLWKVCTDNEVIINVHIGTGVTAPHASMKSPIEAWITTMPMSISNSAADWLFMEALDRYPTLKIALSEGGIGWIPYLLERADFVHEHHSGWTHTSFGPGRKPSDRFREHFLTCFIDDRFGLKNVDEIGVDNIAYECDYPHSDCVWPHTPERLWDSLKHLPVAAINKISHENVFREYHFDAISMMGGPEKCTVGALRAQAKHVNTEAVSLGGATPLKPGEKPRVVTSGDIVDMFRSLRRVA